MFSVSPDVFEVLSLSARYLFVLLALSLVFRSFAGLLSAGKERKDRMRNLPGAGTVGELIVVSGSRELPEETWLPVPREGVLGSVRSCDLVIPCPGVKKHHLDFSWQDGIGLMIRPRSGCEAYVGTVLMDCRSNPRNAPLTHGAYLTVGDAELRFLVFAALSSAEQEDMRASSMAFTPAYPGMVTAQSSGNLAPPGMVSPQFPGNAPVPGMVSPQAPGNATVPGIVNPQFPGSPITPGMVSPQVPGSPTAPGMSPPLQIVPDPATPHTSQPRRADRWKEDWSE